MISVALTRSWRLVYVAALVNPETSILILKRHFYTGRLNSEMSEDQHAAETFKCMSQLGLPVVFVGCRCTNPLAGCLLVKTEMHRAAHN